MDRQAADALDRHITGNYGEDSLPPDEALPGTIGELIDDPRFNDPRGYADGTWRDTEGRDLWDALVADRGYEAARRMWDGACALVDHIAEAHNGEGCDC